MNESILIYVIPIVALFLIYKYYENVKQQKKLAEQTRLTKIEQERKIAEQARLKVEREKIEQQRRDILGQNLNAYIIKIELALNQYNKIVSGKIYISHSIMEQWLFEHKELYNVTSSLYEKQATLSSDNHTAYQNFLSDYKSFSKNRSKLNDKFIKEEINLFNTFFNNEIIPKLDDQQRRAIVIDEDTNLVIAGAGTGKTTTIIGKLAYLKKKFNIDPSQVLALSFTKKSSVDLSNSIKPLGFTASTFHSLGYNVINQSGLPKPDVLSDIEYTQLIIKIFSKLLSNHTYLSAFLDFFIYHLKPFKLQEDFSSQIDYIEYLKANDFKPFKRIPIKIKGIITFKQDVVKSIEECMIANFLFFNGIDYIYEEKYPFPTDLPTFKTYRPDFTITQGKITVYLEHFALNENNEVPHWFSGEDASQKYMDGIIWKQTTHAQNNTTLIESYSHQVKSNTIFKNLTSNLSANGIKLNPISNEEALSYITSNSKREYKAFCDLVSTFITLMKTNRDTPDSVSIKIPKQDTRSLDFLRILSPVFNLYQDSLKQIGKIDFNDMINNAVDIVKSNKIKKNLKYIIVDEYQDIAPNRFQLLKELTANSPNCKLFVVGDDWQSIYRFGGSDISFISSFAKYFPNAAISKIETTYRFNEPLLSISSNFIKANHFQIPKTLLQKSDTSKTFITHYTSKELKNDAETYMTILDTLIESEGTQLKVLTLGRYNFDFYRLLPQKGEGENQKYINSSGLGSLNINVTTNADNKKDIAIRYTSLKHKVAIESEFLTVHRAKGLGEDFIVVLNCNNDILGFPSLLSDDPVLLYLLSTEDSYLHSEERRLFYVALTRAKKGVFLISSQYSPSPFLTDLNLPSDEKKYMCPKCIKYELVVKSSGTDKNGKPYNILGCVNYEFGCTEQKYINLEIPSL